ncbi:MAG: hypothetical protein HN816_14225 [Gammaproteobacteria bacterium]|nr:hypothetical protein [Gammaproteobacteria bacterium]
MERTGQQAVELLAACWGGACKSNQRNKLERLTRYITRPPIAEQRLAVASNGNVIAERRPVALKTPHDDGTSM